MTAIHIENLTKTFASFVKKNEVRAVDNLTLTVEKGEAFGFLGPNGAGKTTTIKMLMNIIYPTSGTMEVLGMRPGNRMLNSQIGFLPEHPYFYDDVNAVELLEFYGDLHRIPKNVLKTRIPELLEMVDLSGAAHRRLRTYSKGMLQRAGLAQALINDPPLIFLDEPSTGLDPVGRRRIKELTRELVRQGKTVFLNSHILPDVEDTCERVAILNYGKLRWIGPVQELTIRKRVLEIELDAISDERLALVKSVLNGNEIQVENNVLRINLLERETVPRLVKALIDDGASVYRVESRQESLEEAFIDIVTDRPEVKDA